LRCSEVAGLFRGDPGILPTVARYQSWMRGTLEPLMDGPIERGQYRQRSGKVKLPAPSYFTRGTLPTQYRMLCIFRVEASDWHRRVSPLKIRRFWIQRFCSSRPHVNSWTLRSRNAQPCRVVICVFAKLNPSGMLDTERNGKTKLEDRNSDTRR